MDLDKRVDKYYRLEWDRYDWDIIRVLEKHKEIWYRCLIVDSHTPEQVGKTYENVLCEDDFKDTNFAVELKHYDTPLWKVLNDQ